MKFLEDRDRKKQETKIRAETSQTRQGNQYDKKAAGRDDCQSVRCDSQSRGNSRRPNRSTGSKPPREGVECDTNLPVHKSVNTFCSIQKNFYIVFTPIGTLFLIKEVNF